MSRPGEPDTVGYKGRIIWWRMWWLFCPLRPVVRVAALFAMPDVPRAPGRVVWRTGGRALVEFKMTWDEIYLRDPALDEGVGPHCWPWSAGSTGRAADGTAGRRSRPSGSAR